MVLGLHELYAVSFMPLSWVNFGVIANYILAFYLRGPLEEDLCADVRCGQVFGICDWSRGPQSTRFRLPFVKDTSKLLQADIKIGYCVRLALGQADLDDG